MAIRPDKSKKQKAEALEHKLKPIGWIRDFLTAAAGVHPASVKNQPSSNPCSTLFH